MCENELRYIDMSINYKFLNGYRKQAGFVRI